MNAARTLTAFALAAAAAGSALAFEPGGLLWRYEIRADFLQNRPTVAPDGTVYASDLTGRLYAINPDGSERWTRDALLGQVGSADEGPVAVFSDGTVLVATNPLGDPIELVAYSPTGEHLWTRTFTGSIAWFAGPSIGPNGHAYLAASGPLADRQALAIDSSGTIVWDTQTSPGLFEENSVGTEAAFVGSSMLFHADQLGGGQLFSLDTDNGSTNYSMFISEVDSVFMQPNQIQVATDNANTRFYIAAAGWGAASRAMRAFNESGSVLWTYDPNIISQVTAPAAGPDGTVYLAWDLFKLAAVEADGSERWRITDDTPIRYQPAPSPNGLSVAIAGMNFGQPGRVEVFSSADGSSLWASELTMPFEGTVTPSTKPVFSPGGDAIYLGSSVFVAGDFGSYVYAFSAAPSTVQCPADTNGDGILSPADFSAWIAAFNAGAPECDQNGDSICTPADFSAWVANFNAGC